MTSLRTRLIATYAVMALLCLGGTSAVIHLFLEARFSDYVRQRISDQRASIVQSLTDSWQGGNGQNSNGTSGWSNDTLTTIGMNALGDGLVLQVSDTSGAMLWDARTHNNGMCDAMLAAIARNMANRYPGWAGNYGEDRFGLTVSGRVVGSAVIGSYGPFYLADAERGYLEGMDRVFYLAGGVALLLAIGLGIFMSRPIALAIAELNASAQRMQQGDYQQAVSVKTRIREIALLSATIGALGKTLAEQEALRIRLTADISHELRTPLATLQGQLEAMIDGIWIADQAHLEGCRQEVLRLTRLVAELEKLEESEATKATLRLAPIDLQSFIEATGKHVLADFQKKEITLSWKAEQGSFLADKDRLTQILVNLLSNASKYSNPGSAVKIEASFSSDGSDVCVAVIDAGCGIPAADLPHVFERFYRVDSSRTRQSGGSGIGLTVARSLARLHGGDIVAQSVEGQGSCFKLHLPRRS